MQNLDKRTFHIFSGHDCKEALEHLCSNPKRYHNLEMEIIPNQINILLADTSRLFLLIYYDGVIIWEHVIAEVEKTLRTIDIANRASRIDRILAEL